MSRISLGKFINQTALLWCSFTRTGQISWPQTTPAFIFCFSAITNKFSLSISTFLFPSHLPIFSSKHLFSFNHSKLMQSGVKEQQLALGSCVQFKNWHLAGVKPSSSSHHPRPRSLWAKLFPFGRGCRCSTKPKKVLLVSILRFPPSQRDYATVTASMNSSTYLNEEKCQLSDGTQIYPAHWSWLYPELPQWTTI